MNKANVIRSSDFHMSEGDVLHILFKDENGDVATITLNTDNDGGDEPLAPTAIDASDILSFSFTANWYFSENALGYYLDVAIDEDFSVFVAGYEDLDVGNVNEYSVVGLTQDSDYYYRVRAYNDNGTSTDSNEITLTTEVNEDILDKDGNLYTTITIGTQKWTVENLKTTTYADDAPIPNLPILDYTDWYLPSRDELNAMYLNLVVENVGSFLNDNFYWSSSEDGGSTTSAWFQYMSTIVPNEDLYPGLAAGEQLNDDKIINVLHVRACRSFTDEVGAYSLRDVGPAGGLIFYIDGTTYYEAAPSDLIDSNWSNIGTGLDPLTGTAIGTGQANTTAIISQVGHTDSAAKLCDDLDIGGWANDTDGAMCYYDNDEATYKEDYGALYNWYAVNNASGLAYLERDGVQEAGWRVPTQTDLDTLVAFVGGDLVGGGKLKEVGIIHWLTPNTDATDEFGFKGLPGGFRYTGSFLSIGENGLIWSTDEYGLTGEGARLTFGSYNQAQCNVYYNPKDTGLSVRLVKDI